MHYHDYSNAKYCLALRLEAVSGPAPAPSFWVSLLRYSLGGPRTISICASLGLGVLGPMGIISAALMEKGFMQRALNFCHPISLPWTFCG